MSVPCTTWAPPGPRSPPLPGRPQAAADVHCEVYHDSRLELDLGAHSTEPSLQQAWSLLGPTTKRMDRLLALQINDNLAETGQGRWAWGA